MLRFFLALCSVHCCHLLLLLFGGCRRTDAASFHQHPPQATPAIRKKNPLVRQQHQRRVVVPQANSGGGRFRHGAVVVLGARATTEKSPDAGSPTKTDGDDDGSTSSTTTHSTSATTTTTTTTPPPPYRPGSLMAATAEQGRVPYGEESRKYRRTVYAAEDWVQHRNEDRILSNLKGIFFSGIVRQLQQEILLVTAISSAVVLLENSGIVEVTLPSLPFQLSSPALGLLLVFRTNTSYARWSEARATWAKIVANSRNIVRMACAFTDFGGSSRTQQQEGGGGDDATAILQLRRLADATWLFNRSVMNRLLSPQEDEERYRSDVRAALQQHDDKGLAERILRLDGAETRTTAALAELSLALDAVRAIDEKRRVEIDKSIVLLGDCYSTCEKIFQTPVPLVYTRHTARFLALWMILLPAALYEPFATEEFSGALFFKGFAVIPTTGIVALFLFGIEELAKQLEEPFSILPLATFCDTIRTSNNDILEWCIESSEMEYDNSKEPATSK